MNVIEIAVKQPKIFKVDERDYFLEFPVSAVITLEAALGRPMKSLSDWLRVSVKELKDVLQAGFQSQHPDEAEQLAVSICKGLDPEDIENVIDALCVVACPKAMARLKEEMEKAQARVKKGLAALPNVPGVDVA